MKRHLCLLAAAFGISSAAMADPVSILFIGNSYTFGRLDPVMSYNTANVHDLTAGFNAISSTGANPWEPHPWGGVPGIFKKFTDESGLDYDVSISARNAASLRGQFLNTANAAWDLRGNVGARRPGTPSCCRSRATRRCRPAAAAMPTSRRSTPTPISSSASSTTAPRRPTPRRSCSAAWPRARPPARRRRPATRSATSRRTRTRAPATKVYLTQTWARPDMVFAHKITRADPTTPDGRPIVDTTSAGGNAILYYGSLAAMTADLRESFAAKASTNPRFAGVLPVGDAFQLAVDRGIAKGSGFYDANGVYVPNAPGGLMNLWWDDYLHASKYGSYLDALVQFGMITGLSPLSLGADEQAAFDLGISSADAVALQRIARRPAFDRGDSGAGDLGAVRRRPAADRAVCEAPRALAGSRRRRETPFSPPRRTPSACRARPPTRGRSRRGCDARPRADGGRAARGARDPASHRARRRHRRAPAGAWSRPAG